MQKGLVSVVMPTYNCVKYISQAIESVLCQTYSNWELIIADDCSLDNTYQIIQPYITEYSKIRYIKNNINLGTAITRNNAIKLASGKWIAFLDSDDLWEPTKLEKQIDFMIKHNYHFSYHEYIEIDEDSKELGVFVSGKRKVNKFDMYSCCWPGCLSVMYDAQYIGLLQINDIKKNNDTALWLKAVKRFDCYLLKDNLGRYRRRKGSITPPSLFARIKWHYILFHDGENKNAIISLFWMCVNVVGNAYKKIFYVKKYKVNQ